MLVSASWRTSLPLSPAHGTLAFDANFRYLRLKTFHLLNCLLHNLAIGEIHRALHHIQNALGVLGRYIAALQDIPDFSSPCVLLSKKHMPKVQLQLADMNLWYHLLYTNGDVARAEDWRMSKPILDPNHVQAIHQMFQALHKTRC